MLGCLTSRRTLLGRSTVHSVYLCVDPNMHVPRHNRSVKQKWTGLTNSLGGLFCSSLNNLDDKMTVSPAFTFSPSLSSSSNSPFFHALLPLEKPCTENLTPFISQLPCRSAAGLAELLNPFKLFDANWQKLAVHVVKDPESGHVEIKLEFEAVQDPVRMTSSVGSQPRRGRRICPAGPAEISAEIDY